MPVKIFFCYAHEDEPLLNKLKAHLRPLQREGLIDVWYDRDISAGIDWEQEISEQLNTAQIILLLISADFMNSDYCYGTEMKRAMERNNRGEARGIPVILRYVLWHGAPFGKLQVLPKDAIPITDPYWHDLDKVFFIVADVIRKAVMDIQQTTLQEKQSGRNDFESNTHSQKSQQSFQSSTAHTVADLAKSPPRMGSKLQWRRFFFVLGLVIGACALVGAIIVGIFLLVSKTEIRQYISYPELLFIFAIILTYLVIVAQYTRQK